MIETKTYFAPFLDSFGTGSGNDDQPGSGQRIPADPGFSNLLSSEMADGSGRHVLRVDIDHPCKLVESSTPGHFHLYVDKPMRPEQMWNLLFEMANAGIVEEGFAAVSAKRGAAFLRPEGVPKGIFLGEEPQPGDLF